MSNTTQFSRKLKIISTNTKGTVLVNNSPGETDMGEFSPENFQAEQEQKTAYQDGWNACEQQMQGRFTEMEQQHAAQIEQLQQQIQEVNQQLPVALGQYFQELEGQMKQEICDLSFQISEIILREEIKNKDIIGNIIQEAIAPLVTLRDVKVHLNPQIVDNINNGANYGIPGGVEIIPDQSVGVGEAMVESSQGFIDGTIEGRLATLKENLDKALKSQRGENV